jgi:hypothetical protein
MADRVMDWRKEAAPEACAAEAPARGLPTESVAVAVLVATGAADMVFVAAVVSVPDADAVETDDALS